MITDTPIPLIFILVVLGMLLCFEAGFRARSRRAADQGELTAPTGSLVGGLVGMMGFVLAITFSIAASHHDDRKQNVLAEANMIGTAYLRADLLPDQAALEMKTLLWDYLDLRLQAAQGVSFLDTALSQSITLHHQLWSLVTTHADASDTRSILVIQSINDLIDMHEVRGNSA